MLKAFAPGTILRGGLTRTSIGPMQDWPVRNASLMHRLIRFLSVAFREYLREMSTPSLGGPDSRRLMKNVYPPRFFLSPPRRIPSKLLRPESLNLPEKPSAPRDVPCLSTTKTRAPLSQTASLCLPTDLRLRITARPVRVRMRTRNPWRRARRVLEGW